KYSARYTRHGKGLREALGAQRRLMRMFEQHAVAGDERRQHGVHRGEVGVVPGSEHHNDADGYALDLAGETRLRSRIDRLERCGGDSQHVAGALFEAAYLA